MSCIELVNVRVRDLDGVVHHARRARISDDKSIQIWLTEDMRESRGWSAGGYEVLVDASVITGIVRDAIYSRHSVAEEVAVCVKRAEESYKEVVGRTVRTEVQGRMFASVANRSRERLTDLMVLRLRFASFSGELISELPAVDDKSARTEPTLAAMARTTEDEVFRAAVRTLGEK
jgi:hypothetical protein